MTPDPLAGTKYRTTRTLGRGGMGFVLEALHTDLDRLVAVKLLHKKQSAGPAALDRFRVERQILAKLSHPNIVVVFDSGITKEGAHYFVMERLRGRSLVDEIGARDTIPVSEAVGWTLEILSALAAAHARGVIHRDIKPGNIWICDGAESGVRSAKLLDFSIAKLASDGAAGIAPLADPTNTEAGVVLGTPRFYSAEQARSEEVGPASDLYSVGLVLYLMLAGCGPFDHCDNSAGLIEAHAEEMPRPPSAYATQPISEALDAVILRALEKRAEDRYPDAHAFAAALRGVREEQTEPMPPRPVRDELPATVAERRDLLPTLALPPSSRRPRKSLAAPVAVVLVVSAIAAFAIHSSRAQAPVPNHPELPASPSSTEGAPEQPSVAVPAATSTPPEKPRKQAPRPIVSTDPWITKEFR